MPYEPGVYVLDKGLVKLVNSCTQKAFLDVESLYIVPAEVVLPDKVIPSNGVLHLLRKKARVKYAKEYGYVLGGPDWDAYRCLEHLITDLGIAQYRRKPQKGDRDTSRVKGNDLVFTFFGISIINSVRVHFDKADKSGGPAPRRKIHDSVDPSQDILPKSTYPDGSG
tara:strand:- start:506 stop:1006 length:501 start_codon:yes stop_codon:yes gene_type:complete